MDNSTVNIGLVQDIHGLDKLRQMSNSDLSAKKEALLTAAQQFESILNQFWLKAMRESNDSICPDSPLKSNDSDMFQSMLDEQMITGLAKANANNSSSLSRLIVKQFARTMGDDGKQIIAEIEGRSNDSNLNSLQLPMRNSFNNVNRVSQSLDDIDMQIEFINRNPVANTVDGNGSLFNDSVDLDNFSDPSDFVEKLMPIAKKIAEKFNLNPVVIVAQAALETGWGKHLSSDKNLFGIKATNSWNGNSTLQQTDEYVNGVRVSEVAAFRSYSSVENSVEDYANFIVSNKRYAKAASVSSDPDQYFEEIQKAGYATDPNYASKLKSIVRNDAFTSYL